MDETDLRLHLSLQGLAPIALLDLRAYEQTTQRIDAMFEPLLCSVANEAPQAVLFDVVQDSQLATVGRLLWQRAKVSQQLCAGSSRAARWAATTYSSG